MVPVGDVKMSLNSVIIAPECVRRRLQQEYDADDATGYKPLADKYGVSAATIWRILTEGYVPKTYEMQKKLGYLPICPQCGYEW